MSKEKKKTTVTKTEAGSAKKSFWQAAVVGAKLLLICAIVAGVVSFVYALTAEQYAINMQATKNEAIGEIFGLSAPKCEALPAEGLEIEETVFKVYDGDTHVGYCVEVKSGGFGGDITMMVGYTADCTMLGVEIVSMSETPGLGSKAGEAPFLSQFAGKTDTLTLGEDVDAISGATISSKAVTEGVNQAFQSLQNVLSLNGGAIR